MTFNELLDEYLFGMRGEQRRRAKASFIAGAQAASTIVRDNLCGIDVMGYEDRRKDVRKWALVGSEKPKRQPYFIVGKNKAA